MGIGFLILESHGIMQVPDNEWTSAKDFAETGQLCQESHNFPELLAWLDVFGCEVFEGLTVPGLSQLAW